MDRARTAYDTNDANLARRLPQVRYWVTWPGMARISRIAARTWHRSLLTDASNKLFDGSAPSGHGFRSPRLSKHTAHS
jgi:hypothetical protein